MFPEDEQPNPYSSTYDQVAVEARTSREGEIIPTCVEAGDVMAYAWEQYKRFWAPLVGALLVTVIISYVLQLASGFIQIALLPPAAPGPGGNPFGPRAAGNEWIPVVMFLVLQAVQQFLGIGFTRMALSAGRGQAPSFEQLFSGGRWFLPIIGFMILFCLGVAVGFALLIVPGFLLLLMWWPARILIVDDQCGVMDSFGKASEIAKGNWGTALLLALISFGLIALGFLAFCVGTLFTGPLVSLIWVSAYLMMSGQVGRFSDSSVNTPPDYGYVAEFDENAT